MRMQPGGQNPFDPNSIQQPGAQPQQNPYFGPYYQQPSMQQPVYQQPMTPEQMYQGANPQQAPYQPMTPEQMQYQAWMQQMPPTPTAQTPMDPPKQRRKKKKNQSGGGKVWKTVLALALIGGVAWFFLKDMIGKPTVSTALVENGTMGETYSGDALIVRNETSYDEEGVQNIEYVAQEGSVVYRGDVICYVYSTGFSSKEMTTLQSYRDQIKDFEQSLLKSETAYDQKMTRLENDVVERGLEVRSLVQGARGNLINQEKILATSITQRQSYFRSKYSSEARLNRLFDDENTQQQRIDGWIKQKVATQESIVSFYTDGFEQALSPSSYETYTPSQVRAMMQGEKPATSAASRGRTALYRMVKQNNYAVLMLIKNSTWNPVEGTTYKLVLEQFSNTVVDAQLLSFTRSGGELLLRLAVIGDVSDVLYMRTCTAQLGEYVDCLVVPQGALYKRDETQGVVLMGDDGNSWFVPVKVLNTDGGKAYITPVQTGSLTSGQTVRLFK